MRVGILGLKYTGKTTLYNAITGAKQPTGQGGVDPHQAIGRIPDLRLDRLSDMFRPRRTTHATVEWVDLPGFDVGVPGAARESNRFLEQARKLDALVQVVRCFGNGPAAPDPLAEMETMALEIGLADLVIVENRLERLAKELRIKGKLACPGEPVMLERFRQTLESGGALRTLELTPDEAKLASGFTFLTLKPLILVLNGGDEGVDAQVIAAARATGAEVVDLCARTEAEIAELPLAERAEFLAELGIAEPASHRMVQAAYRALGLQSFFTVGEDECRAWTIRRGARAPEAARVIHSDLERGFIRAETCSFEELVAAGSLAELKRTGKLRLEGKSYEVRDGDILNIRFSV